MSEKKGRVKMKRRRFFKRILASVLSAVLVITSLPLTTAFAAFGDEWHDYDYHRLIGLQFPRAIDMMHDYYYEYTHTSEFVAGKEWVYLKFTSAFNEPMDIAVYQYTPADDEETIVENAGKIYSKGAGLYPADPSHVGERVGIVSGLQLTDHVKRVGDKYQSKKQKVAQIEDMLRKLCGEPEEGEEVPEVETQPMENIDVFGAYGDDLPGRKTVLTQQKKPEEGPAEDNHSEEESGPPEEENGSEGKLETRTLAEGNIDDSAKGVEYIHNFIAWKGDVVPDGGGAPVPLEQGIYMIVFEPKDPSVAAYKGYLPFIVADPSTDPAKMQEKAQALTDPLNLQWGDPVNAINGNLAWEYKDLQVEGDEPLYFSRLYNSINAEDTFGIGNGWSHTYAYKAELNKSYANVTLASGDSVYFEVDYDGTFSHPRGCPYEFKKSGGSFILLNKRTNEQVLFDSKGYPTEMIDAKGRSTTIEQTGGKLQSVSNSTGTLTFTYNGENISSVSDDAGRMVTYTYSGGDLAKTINPDSDSLKYTYDGDHNLIKVENFNGTIYMTNVYDGSHRVIEQYLPERGTSFYEYDLEAGINRYRDENGKEAAIQYDENHRITEETTNDGTRTFRYDKLDRVIEETDRRGSTYSYEYDGETQNKSQTAYPDGTTERFVYNRFNQVTEMTQRDGSVLSFTYDDKGNMLTATDANSGTRTYTYDGRNYITSSTDALDNTTTYECDNRGNIVGMTDPKGNETTYAYDDVGRLTRVTSPLGHTTTYRYSEAGKLISETDATGHTRTYKYTPNGYETSVGDWNGNAIQYTYNAMNQKLTMADAEGKITQYTYDGAGNLASSTDPDGHRMSYRYDPSGHVIGMTDGNGNTSEYSYDENGNLTAILDPMGNSASKAYDVLNQTISESNERGAVVSCERDAMGRIISSTDAEGGVTRYTYDAMEIEPRL